VLGANRAFLEIVELQLEEVIGMTPPFPWWSGADEAGLGIDPGERAERVYRMPDGRALRIEVTTHAISDDDGQPLILFQVVGDFSERRRLEQQLVQSAKLAAIGELAAGVAHEINNPLFAILGLTEFLLKDAEPGSKERSRLELIEQTGQEIKEIVRALIEFARENSDERHRVALEEVARSTIELVRRTSANKGVELIETYPDSSTLVTASPNQLKQVFLNVIANARQAMPNGGTIRVDVRREGAHAVATISDDGPGIAPDHVGRIFEPFFTTRRGQGGTGLGLSVSLGIANAHGGSLTVTTELGDGAAFALRLPVAEENGA